MENKKITKEIAAAKKAIASLPQTHELAPESWKEELRNEARDMSCGGMFRSSPRKAGHSYNAMYAEGRGELTKSKLPAVLKRMVEAGFAHSTMWHHTGQFKGHMNETLFYAGKDFDITGYENYLWNKEEIDSQREADEKVKQKKASEEKEIRMQIDELKKEWLRENCNYVTRVTRRLFIEDAREMSGKFGWFDSSTKSYNLTEYFTGWELKEGVEANEYYSISVESLRLRQTHG